MSEGSQSVKGYVNAEIRYWLQHVVLPHESHEDHFRLLFSSHQSISMPQKLSFG